KVKGSIPLGGSTGSPRHLVAGASVVPGPLGGGAREGCTQDDFREPNPEGTPGASGAKPQARGSESACTRGRPGASSQTVTPAQAFDIEYWELEQAKLR